MAQNQVQATIEDGAIGSEIECYVRVENLRYPKKPIDQVDYGENGIIQLFSEDVLKGKFPEELVAPVPRLFSFDDTEEKPNGRVEVHFVAKGPLPRLTYSSLYYFRGVLVEDLRYGPQYRIKEFHRVYQLKEEETEIFLRAILSEHRAKLLMDNFEDPLQPLRDKDMEALCSIPGVGYATAESILRAYENNFEEGTAFVQLAEYGLTPNMINTLQEIFKSIDTVLYVLQNDPYSLIDMVSGIGWKKADAIAANGSNFGPTSEKRVKAYTKYFLKECVEQYGHSWVDLDFLVTAIKTEIVNLQDEDLLQMMQSWIVDSDDGKAWLYYERESRRIGLSYYRQVEERIAKNLIRLEHENAKVYSNEEVEEGIASAEAQLGFEYTEEQKNAIKFCLTHGVTIISGSAGTGKTTIMKAVTAVLMRNNKTFAQCSLSGKASSNLTEVTGIEGKTIHRLLIYNPETGRFVHDANHKLMVDAIIVDELSLIGGELFLQLLEAIPNGCKLICLGDEKQLESIGMANLLKDCINCHILPAQRLIKIHRQAAKSGIITESLRASAQEQIVTHSPGVDIRGELQDFKIVSCTESAPVADNFIEEYSDLYFKKNIPVKDIMGIAPMRDKGDISCLALNRKIQALVNGLPQTEEVIVGDLEEKGYILRVGDKVLVTKNDYHTIDHIAATELEAKWKEEGKKKGDKLPQLPIYNGNTGFLISVNKDRGFFVVRLAQGDVRINFASKSTIELGYVITAHKSQGSGSPYVIVALTMQAYALLSKEWIYTALTRAKKYCILCTQINAARQAVTISRVQVKHTWLQELLINYEKEFKESGIYPFYNIDDSLKNYLGRSKELQIAFAKAGERGGELNG